MGLLPSFRFILSCQGPFQSAAAVRHASGSARRVDIILLQDHASLGRQGSVIRVKPGYMRNYLHPNRVAIYATPENILYCQKEASMSLRVPPRVLPLAPTTTQAESPIAKGSH